MEQRFFLLAKQFPSFDSMDRLMRLQASSLDIRGRFLEVSYHSGLDRVALVPLYEKRQAVDDDIFLVVDARLAKLGHQL